MKRTMIPAALGALVLLACLMKSDPPASRRAPVPCAPEIPIVESRTPAPIRLDERKVGVESPARPMPADADGLAVWLLELPDDRLAELLGTEEMHRHVARVLTELEARHPEGRSPEIPAFLDRLNARIRSVHRG